MISFKQYLEEAIISKWSTTDLNLEECINLLNAHCKDGLKAITTGGLLFRGFDGEKQPNLYHLIDTTNAVRTSRDSNNLYQLGMDNAEALSEFPKRSHSLICSANPYTAGLYAVHHPLVVIPFDGAKIAVSKQSDFLRDTHVSHNIFGDDGIDDMLDSLSDIFYELRVRPDAKNQYVDYSLLEKKLASISSAALLFEILANLDIDLDNSTYDIINGDDEVKTRIQEFENYLKSGKCKNKNIVNLFNRLENNKNNKFAALLSDLLTPAKLGLTLVTFGNALPKDGECWVTGKAILLEFKTFLEIIKELKKSKFPIHPRYKDLME